MGSIWQYAHDVVRGRRQGVDASAVRAALSAAELPYTAVVRIRNRLYDRGVLSASRLGRPTVSVGNLTAGGTGKTPVVRWLAANLSSRGYRPAVLMRGYAADAADRSDEALELLAGLPAGSVIVEPDPDRILAAIRVLENAPTTGVFVLDDAFQHRRAARDVDLVLVNASDPFGLGHVHPRGLLREPIDGIARAHAVLVTHARDIDSQASREIDETVRRYSDVPIFRCDHVIAGVIDPASGLTRPLTPEESPAMLVAGVGHPQGVLTAARAAGMQVVDTRYFPDHHPYTPSELHQLLADAGQSSAGSVVTTGKDYTKLGPLLHRHPAARASRLPILPMALEMRFHGSDESTLLQLVLRGLNLPDAGTSTSSREFRPA